MERRMKNNLRSQKKNEYFKMKKFWQTLDETKALRKKKQELMKKKDLLSLLKQKINRKSKVIEAHEIVLMKVLTINIQLKNRKILTMITNNCLKLMKILRSTNITSSQVNIIFELSSKVKESSKQKIMGIEMCWLNLKSIRVVK